MATVSADLDAMRGVSKKFADDYGSLVSTMTRLTNDAEGFSAAWVGKGADAFRSAKDAVEGAWASLNAALDEIATNIGQASAGYDNQDSNVAAAVNKVPTTGISQSLTAQ